MTARPIIFSAPMVRALLDGRKTMTRRLAWKLPYVSPDFPGKPTTWQKVRTGDLLWVRETIIPSATGFEYAAGPNIDHIDLGDLDDDQVEFWNRRAGLDPDNSPKVSPIHMPRWASRLTLRVTATRIEQLQVISDDEAKAEGIDRVQNDFGNGPAYCDYGLGDLDDTAEWFASPLDSFASLWRSLHGPESWDANPWVVVVTFTVAKGNIDKLAASVEL